MPLVKSIVALADGWEVVTTMRGTITFTSDDLPNNVKNDPLPDVEAWMNARLYNLNGSPDNGYIVVHLTSAVPLQGKVFVSDDPPPPNWWAALPVPVL